MMHHLSILENITLAPINVQKRRQREANEYGMYLLNQMGIDSHAKKYTNLIFVDLDDITEHYVTTLQLWRKNFFDKIDKIKDLGFSNSFVKLWEFYFVYCEAGFAEKNIGDYQFTFIKNKGLVLK